MSGGWWAVDGSGGDGNEDLDSTTAVLSTTIGIRTEITMSVIKTATVIRTDDSDISLQRPRNNKNKQQDETQRSDTLRSSDTCTHEFSDGAGSQILSCRPHLFHVCACARNMSELERPPHQTR